MSGLRRWRGLKALLVDAALHGSAAVERLQRETAGRPFAVLEALPLIGTPARGVHVVHELALGLTHRAIRAGVRAAGAVLELALDRAEAGGPADGPAS